MNSSSPAEIPSKPPAAKAFVSSQASGAPSEPCFGASLRFLIVDRMIAIGRSSSRAPRTEDFFRRLRPPLRLVMLTSSKLQSSAFFSAFAAAGTAQSQPRFLHGVISSVTRRFSSMNQGIRTLIYIVEDARRGSMFFRQLLGVAPCVEQLSRPPQARRPEISFRLNGSLSRFGTQLHAPPAHISHSFDHSSLHA